MFYLFYYDKCILFIHCINFFWQTFTSIWADKKYMVTPSRKDGTPRIRLLTPTEFQIMESKQMTARVIYCVHLRVRLTPCSIGFYIPCSVPTTEWLKYEDRK